MRTMIRGRTRVLRSPGPRRDPREELGIGPSIEACAGARPGPRSRAVAVRRPAPAPSAAPSSASSGDAARPLLHHDRRRAPGLRRRAARPSVGEGEQLAEPPRLRLGQPGVASLVAGAVGAHTLVRYDERGCGRPTGRSTLPSFTLEAWVRDLETVVDALGLERFPLLGISQGGPIAVTYAARHPERVSHVIVYGTCARATWARATDDQRRELAPWGSDRTSWGTDQPGFRQVYDARFLPDGPLELWRAFDELQRRRRHPATPTGCGGRSGRSTAPMPPGHRADAHPPRHRRSGLVVPEAEDLHAIVAGTHGLPSSNHILQARSAPPSSTKSSVSAVELVTPAARTVRARRRRARGTTDLSLDMVLHDVAAGDAQLVGDGPPTQRR